MQPNTDPTTTRYRGTGVALRAVLSKLYIRLQYAAVQSVEHSRPNIVSVGLVCLVGFPLYYIVWVYIFPQPYENLPMRLIGAAFAVPMLLVDHWPSSIRQYLPAYWFCCIFYALPFFFTFMLLKNDGSMVWAMSTMAGAVLLVLLVNDWVMLAVTVGAGCGLAWLCFDLSGGELLVEDRYSYLIQLPIYFFVLVAGSIFNYKAELLKQEKLEAVESTTSNIAHELRTPLLSIRSGVGGLNRYLPQLLEAYELAQAHGLPVQRIRTAHYHQLTSVLDRIETETQYSNLVIDLLLSNAQRARIDTDEFARILMSECISEALDRYPFKSDEERNRVRWHSENDFSFDGSTVLMVHVLFNLLKNALYSTATTGKSRNGITIWMTSADQGYNLHFHDTGQGISPDKLPFIFNRFYSSDKAGHGTGIGLAFCKMVMKSVGGKISCSSKPEKFTEFVLYFPGAEGHGNT